MALKRLVLELGMGTALRSGSYTKAACRAVQNALWHNSLALVELFGAEKDAMVITVEIACQNPEKVDCEKVAAEFPYGQVSAKLFIFSLLTKCLESEFLFAGGLFQFVPNYLQ
jgi:uncharacterized protein (TIGR02058 family)